MMLQVLNSCIYNSRQIIEDLRTICMYIEKTSTWAFSYKRFQQSFIYLLHCVMDS